MSPAPVALGRVASVLRAAGLLVETLGSEDVAVRGVSQDSRSSEPGDLFLAWKGTELDAHAFAAEAVRRGSVACVVERPLTVGVSQLVVRDGRRAAAIAADVVTGSPWKDLFLAAVTGTNGKTTTAHILRHVLAHRGPAASLGTLGLVEPDGSVRDGTHGLTTPGPVAVSTCLRDLADEGVAFVAMEASSHALAQARLDGLRFDVAIFTNLSRDHLDYHEDFGAYFAAKAHLVDLLSDSGVVVVNAAERAWSELPARGRRVTYGLAGDADVSAADVATDATGSTFALRVEGRAWAVELPLPGAFNVENALAAAAAALAAELSAEEIAERMASLPQIPGRMEVVVREPFTVVIDFAHTPDALARVLDALVGEAEGRLIVLFGAGGDRDRSKRAPMARAVAARAQVLVLTSDNPRTEDPERILDDLEAGVGDARAVREVDRRKAIGMALAMAAPGDVVVLAGKGHETHQIVGTEKLPFDERAVVHEYLEGAA